MDSQKLREVSELIATAEKRGQIPSIRAMLTQLTQERAELLGILKSEAEMIKAIRTAMPEATWSDSLGAHELALRTALAKAET